MKPVAWIKIRELSYMKAVAEHGKDDWQTNLGLKPEPDDEGLYTETQVQRMIELHEVNAELVEALKQVMLWIENWSPEFSRDPVWSFDRDAALAALAKAQGDNNG